MIPLNHQHLYYFWVVAREGSVSKAAEKLFLTQPTVSGQLAQLEGFLKKKLFERERNRLVLTEEGRFVLEYANHIFNASEEMLEALQQGAPHKDNPRIRLGIDTHVSKQVALRCLRMVYAYKPGIQITLQEGSLKDLLPSLRSRELDLLLSEQINLAKPSDPYINVEVGRVKIFFVAAPRIARQVRRFPRDLANIPLLLPAPSTPLWISIEQFLVQHKIQPKAIGKIHDFEFMRLLALEGAGAAPLHEMAVSADLKAGRLVRLGHRGTGIVKTLWLVAGQARRANPVVNYLLKNFRFGG
ncbi:MAG TPA: LysR family transcriptional regulator [Elusimicrobiota bacterium]|nr:LysR family transcriptional regulator [Elusimicrobiota bacterium]